MLKDYERRLVPSGFEHRSGSARARTVGAIPLAPTKDPLCVGVCRANTERLTEGVDHLSKAARETDVYQGAADARDQSPPLIAGVRGNNGFYSLPC